MKKQLKWLISCGQNGNAGRSRGLTSSTRGQDAGRSNCRCLRLRTPKAETSKSRIFASIGENPIFAPQLRFLRAEMGQCRSGSFEPNRGKLTVSEAYGGAGVGSWRKRMPLCNGADTGSEFARRESEQTSKGCLIARKYMGTALNGESKGKWRLRSTICALHPSGVLKPGGSVRVTQSALTKSGYQHAGRREAAFEVLEPYVWKLTSTVLRGARGRQRPRVYSTASLSTACCGPSNTTTKMLIYRG